MNCDVPTYAEWCCISASTVPKVHKYHVLETICDFSILPGKAYDVSCTMQLFWGVLLYIMCTILEFEKTVNKCGYLASTVYNWSKGITYDINAGFEYTPINYIRRNK